MKTYQFQILRYTHDLPTQEFVNVGIVGKVAQSGSLRQILSY